MVKMDTYGNIPIVSKDCHLLGFQWDGNIFINKVLPFGLRSVPFIFTMVADADGVNLYTSKSDIARKVARSHH